MKEDGRKNNGRKAGSINKATADSKLAKKLFVDRVNKNVDKLFNSQLDLAIGEKYLMVVRTIGTGSKQRRETEVVTDIDIIKQYLDESLDDTDEEFYFMTTKPANNQALDSLLNRSFGKPKESLDVTSGGEPLKALVEFVDARDENTTS
jgi:hypothetical protein